MGSPIDLEKVINELRFQLNSKEVKDQHYPVQLSVSDANAILSMLKEQEAVAPYVTGNGESFETAENLWYECGNCNKPIDSTDKFCRHCGRLVKWE